MGILKPEKNGGLRATPAPYLDKRVTKWLFKKKKTNPQAKKAVKKTGREINKFIKGIYEYEGG